LPCCCCASSRAACCVSSVWILPCASVLLHSRVRLLVCDVHSHVITCDWLYSPAESQTRFI
jgi:hypothetical protein